MNRYLLLDGNNLAIRALHATQGRPLSGGGVPTGALLVFANALARLITEVDPTHIAVAWDGHSKLRYGLLPTYKANREQAPAQVELEKGDVILLAQAFLDAARITSHHHPDYEGDDIIAALWKAIGSGEIVIASSDKDFFQLCGANPHGVPTELIRFSSGPDLDRWTTERFASEKGFESRYWPLVTALTGDSSDNVKGIPGIGPKRAVKLLERHQWDLDTALGDHPDHRELVLTNLRLVNLREPALKIAPPTRTALPVYGDPHDRLDTFLAGFALTSLRERHQQGRLWRRPTLPGRSLSRSGTAEGRAT